MTGRVAGLVLAAGGGSRLGRPKAFLDVGGEPLAERAVRVLRDGGCAPVIVVLGAVVGRVPGADSVVVNPDWASGIGSSLRAGLAALPGVAVVVALADQPGISPEAVERLRAAYASGASVAVATYGGRRRNPVLIGPGHHADASRLAVGDVGARAFLAAHPEVVVGVECGDVSDPRDIDTPADLTPP